MDSYKRDHGGGIDAAAARYGGDRNAWIDLSTGINPAPYPLPPLPTDAWTALPDEAALTRLEQAARTLWQLPPEAGLLAVPGASVAIAQIPHLSKPGQVWIPGPTYNEHAASFAQAGWQICQTPDAANASVHVHPNNPDGRLWSEQDPTGDLCVIDESFCDVMPDASLIALAGRPGHLILKSFGKFWGLAGLRLGFVIGDPALIKALRARIGPWAVAGPALAIGSAALADRTWAETTRKRLRLDAQRLDDLLIRRGATLQGGTDLFRLYQVDDAAAWQDRLARHQIWTRIFPYSDHWLRLGLPPAQGWSRLEAALS